MNRLSCALAAASLLLPFSTSVADDAAPAARNVKVVIVSMTRCCASSAWPEAEAKVAMELAALGARVERVDGASAEGHAQGNQLAKALDDQDVVAALQIVRDGAGSAAADLLIRDTKTRKAVGKHLAFSPAPGKEGVPVAALKIVELLTAGVLELSIKPVEKPAPAPSAAAASPAAEPATPVGPAVRPVTIDVNRPSVANPHAIALSAGAGATLAPGNVALLPAGFLAVNVAISPRFSAEIEGSLTLPGRTVPYGGAKADFFEGTARGWALFEVFEYGALSGNLGPGAGVVFANVRGHDATTRKGVEDLLVTSYAGATTRLAVTLGDTFRLGLFLNAGAALPRVKVRYSLEDSLTFGWPFVEAAVFVGANVF